MGTDVSASAALDKDRNLNDLFMCTHLRLFADWKGGQEASISHGNASSPMGNQDSISPSWPIAYA